MNKEQRKQYMIEYYKINREKLLDYKKNYDKTHQQKNIEYRISYKIKRNQRYNNRRKIDINFKIRGNLKHRIWLSLKGFNKSKTTTKLLGCSIEHLKQHLEKQFNNGMSWLNYGKWHIDHIKPCASFDLSKTKEQKKCFHYSNLQPLWAKDNLSKSDKIILTKNGRHTK
jgi:hypothetical protein